MRRERREIKSLIEEGKEKGKETRKSRIWGNGEGNQREEWENVEWKDGENKNKKKNEKTIKKILRENED